jgi:hypothetical protein
MEVQVEATKTVESYYPDNYRRVFIINGKLTLSLTADRPTGPRSSRDTTTH